MTVSGLPYFSARLLGVGINIGVDALDQRMREPFFDGAFAPFFLDLFIAEGGAGAAAFNFSPKAPGARWRRDGGSTTHLPRGFSARD